MCIRGGKQPCDCDDSNFKLKQKAGWLVAWLTGWLAAWLCALMALAVWSGFRGMGAVCGVSGTRRRSRGRGGHDGSRRGPGEPRPGRVKRGGWMEEEEKKAGVNENGRMIWTGGGEVKTRRRRWVKERIRWEVKWQRKRRKTVGEKERKTEERTKKVVTMKNI